MSFRIAAATPKVVAARFVLPLFQSSIVRTPVPDVALPKTNEFVDDVPPKSIVPFVNERLPTLSEKLFRLSVLLVSVRFEDELIALLTPSCTVPPDRKSTRLNS